MSFPVTAFQPDGTLNLAAYRVHVEDQVAAGPAAIFVACGTGEFFSLDVEEYGQVVRAAVEAANGRRPVFAGVGYGTTLAIRLARLAEEAGVQGLLILPPYLVHAPQEGLVAHYRAVAAATDLPVIVYQRDNVRLTPQAAAELVAVPNVVGLKDGLGDLDLLQRISGAIRDARRADPSIADPVLLNGLPTAEMTALAYWGIGVRSYSSAVFCFAPDIALAFNKALRAGDLTLVEAYLDGFFRPLVELRARGAGYAVSLVKAGVRLAGFEVGPVRRPLTDPRPEHVRQLRDIIAAGRVIG
ncbi:5-dehydro-4-deoxyglucarate dehydratase [Micromonospora deserti]|uniref:Probable 5-dehydro-4-deoxyglucarate dehydratase n=2 Tax=Micromonospora deserti TaxID=2070366 RepID=A0A2W2EAP5_9ACTN|nr:5-dehydro-4-deoxyglucarate dehydratase [Micromonospora deserti]